MMIARRLAPRLAAFALLPLLIAQEPSPTTPAPRSASTAKWQSPSGEVQVLHAPPGADTQPRWVVWWKPQDARQCQELLFHLDELQRRHGERGVRIAVVLPPADAKALAQKQPNVAVTTPTPSDDELPEGPQDHVWDGGLSAHLTTGDGDLLGELPLDALDDALTACIQNGDPSAAMVPAHELASHLYNVTDAEVPEAAAQAVRKALPHCGGAHATVVLEAWWGRGDHAAAMAAIDTGLRELSGHTYSMLVFCDLVLRGDHTDSAVPRRLVVELAPVVAAAGDNPFAQLVYLRALLRAGNARLAGRIVAKLPKLLGERADLHLQLAEILMDAPEPAAFRALAEQQLAIAEKVGQDLETARMVRHKILSRCGDRAAAKKLFEEGHPEASSDGLNNVAWYCCVRLDTMGRFATFADDVASAMVERAGERLESNNRDTVALAFFCAGRVAEAVEQQRTALREHRGDARFEGRMRRYEDALQRMPKQPATPKPDGK